MQTSETANKTSGIELGNNYKLVKVIMCAKDTLHIPYIAGCLVEGPKGATYCLDCFGFEQLVKSLNLQVVQRYQSVAVINKSKYIECKCIFGDEILSGHSDLYNTNEKIMKRYSQVHGLRFIDRGTVFDYIAKIVR